MSSRKNPYASSDVRGRPFLEILVKRQRNLKSAMSPVRRPVSKGAPTIMPRPKHLGIAPETPTLRPRPSNSSPRPPPLAPNRT